MHKSSIMKQVIKDIGLQFKLLILKKSINYAKIMLPQKFE